MATGELIDYHEVTGDELRKFQRAQADANPDDRHNMAVRVSAEAIRLMGLARHWNMRALRAEEALERADGVHREFLKQMATLPCLQSANGCHEAKDLART